MHIYACLLSVDSLLSSFSFRMLLALFLVLLSWIFLFGLLFHIGGSVFSDVSPSFLPQFLFVLCMCGSATNERVLCVLCNAEFWNNIVIESKLIIRKDAGKPPATKLKYKTRNHYSPIHSRVLSISNYDSMQLLCDFSVSSSLVHAQKSTHTHTHTFWFLPSVLAKKLAECSMCVTQKKSLEYKRNRHLYVLSKYKFHSQRMRDIK